jgi:hypothetical protein
VVQGITATVVSVQVLRYDAEQRASEVRLAYKFLTVPSETKWRLEEVFRTAEMWAEKSQGGPKEEG